MPAPTALTFLHMQSTHISACPVLPHAPLPPFTLRLPCYDSCRCNCTPLRFISLNSFHNVPRTSTAPALLCDSH
eukprot:639504-Pleurochrysis_carterae.AAC.1